MSTTPMSLPPTATPPHDPTPSGAPLPPGVPQSTDNPDISFDAVFGNPDAPAAAPDDAPAPAPEPAPGPTVEQLTQQMQSMNQQLQWYQQQAAQAQWQQQQAPVPQAPPPETMTPQQRQAIVVALNDTVSGARPGAFDELMGQMISTRSRQEAEMILRSALTPLAPIIQYANMNRGLEMASKAQNWGDPNIPAFRNSPTFQTAIRNFPYLADAIQRAERNPEYAGQLAELYGLAYMAGTRATPAAPAPRPPATATPALRPATAPTAQGGGIQDIPLDDIFSSTRGYR